MTETKSRKASESAQILSKSIGSHLQAESLRWIFSLSAAILVFIIVASITAKVYDPNLPALLDMAYKFGFEGPARPEPLEQLLFRIGIVTIVFVSIGVYIFLKKNDFFNDRKNLFISVSFLIPALIAVMGCLDYNAINPFGPDSGFNPESARDAVSRTNFEFYFNGLFIQKYFWIYNLFLFPAIAVLFFTILRKNSIADNSTFSKALDICIYVFFGSLILSIFLMNVYKFPYTYENKYDFNAVYYSMTQVYAGIPMLVDGFSNTYGLYPHFLNIIFCFLGLTILNFSFVLSLLLAIALGFNFFVLRHLVENKILLILGFASVIFIPYLSYQFLMPHDSIFALFPIRYILPSMLTFWGVLYLRKKSRLIYYMATVSMAGGLLWNPEIGIVCFLAWPAFNSYIDFYSVGKVNYKRIAFHWLVSLMILAAIIGFYMLCVKVYYHRVPDLNLLFGFISLFAKAGFGLLPMPLIHPWNILALVISVGFFYSLTRLISNKVTTNSSIVFLLSIVALGFLIYYQGRSHNWSFTVTSGFGIMLLTALSDELWILVKKTNFLLFALLFLITLYIISFSFFEILNPEAFDRIGKMISAKEERLNQAGEEAMIKSNRDFVKSNTRKGEKIFVLTARPYQGLYFDGTKRKSAFNPSMQDMFLNADLERMENILIDSSHKVFIQPDLATYSFMLKPIAALVARYEYRDANQNMYMLKPGMIKTHPQEFLNIKNPIFYKKYTADRAGIKNRVNDATGIDSLTIDSPLSVAVLFRTGKQIYSEAVVLGNATDTSGFVIFNVPNTNNYNFIVNGSGLSIELPENDWLFCVMNILKDRCDIFINGNLVGSFALTQGMKHSSMKLFVGNLGPGIHYYLGCISEVSLSKTIFSENEIKSLWESIDAAL